MASYIIDIDDHSQKARRFLEFLKDYASDNNFVQIEKSPSKATRKAIDDARKGKTFKAESTKALFDSI